MSFKVPQFYANEIAASTDFSDFSDLTIENIAFLLSLISGQTDVIFSGFTVQERGTPSMNVDVLSGFALSVEQSALIHGASDAGPIAVTAADPTNDRIDIVEIQVLTTDDDAQNRAFKNPSTGVVTNQLVPTKKEYEVNIQITAGTPAGTPAAPSKTSGWLKIAEILVPAASSTVVDENIFNCTARTSGEESENWTTEKDITAIIGSMSTQKVLSIQSDMDIIKSVFEGMFNTEGNVLLRMEPMTEGASVSLLNIPSVVGVIKPSQDMGYATIGKMFIRSSDETDYSLSSATLDGSTINYVKIYLDSNSQGYVIDIDATPPTDIELLLGTIIGDGSTFLTINQEYTEHIGNLFLHKLLYNSENDSVLYTGDGDLWELNSSAIINNKNEQALLAIGCTIDEDNNGIIFPGKSSLYIKYEDAVGEAKPLVCLYHQFGDIGTIEFWYHGLISGGSQSFIGPIIELRATNDMVAVNNENIIVIDTAFAAVFAYTDGSNYVQSDFSNPLITTVGSPNHIKIVWNKATNALRAYINGDESFAESVTGSGMSGMNFSQINSVWLGGKPLTTALQQTPGWFSDLLIQDAYDISTTHFTSGKPYYSKNRSINKEGNITIGEKCIAAKEIFCNGRRILGGEKSFIGGYFVGGISLSDGSPTKLTIYPYYDSNQEFSSSSNTFVIKERGLYLFTVNGRTEAESNATAYSFDIQIVVNGSAVSASFDTGSASGSKRFGVSFSDLLYLLEGDVVQFNGLCVGFSGALEAASDEVYNKFSIERKA